MKKKLLSLFVAIIGLTTNIGILHAQTDNWSSHEETVTASGDEYLISTPEQLAWIANQANGEIPNNFEGKTIKLANDIDLAAYEWTPIGNVIEKGFKGTFDGNNKTISNMKISIALSQEAPEKAIGGLFGYILDKAIVKNITVAGSSSIDLMVNAYKDATAGGIVAKATGTPNAEGKETAFTGKIENCHTTVSISVSISPQSEMETKSDHSAFVGGIAGSVYAPGKKSTDSDYPSVINCSSSGNITSISTTTKPTNGVLSGGIIGRAESVKVQNCYSTGNITSTGGQTPYAGGIIGHISYEVQILDCYSTGNIVSSSDRPEVTYSIAGGISGTISQNSVVKNCYATGNISATLPNSTVSSSEIWAGGIVGYAINKAGSKIENCAALNGTISISGNNAITTTNKVAHRVLGKNEGQTTISGNYASQKIKISKDGTDVTITESDNDASKEGGAIIASNDLATLFTAQNGWTLSETTLPTLTNCGTATQTTKDLLDLFDHKDVLLTLLTRTDVEAITLKAGATYDFTSAPLMLTKKVTLNSDPNNKAVIKGNICIETDEEVTLDNLKIVTESTGTNYWLKNAVSVIGKNATITNCNFEGSIEKGKDYVVNGVVLFPTDADAKYTVTGNTFTKFNAKLDDKGTASAAILMADGYTLTKKEGGTVTLPAVTTYKEESISDANTYTDCYADYIHANYTDNENYLYSRISSPESALVSLLLTKTSGGTIQANGVTVKAVVDAMNNGTDKSDLSSADVVIECSDGVIATKESTAKQLTKDGKNVKMLAYNSGETSNYSIKTYTIELPAITNLPASVVFGTEPLKLTFNQDNVTATVASGSSDYAEITDNVLTFKKPTGETPVAITVKKNSATNGGGDEEVNTQTFVITKRPITLIAGILVDYTSYTNGLTYNNEATAKIYDRTTNIVLKLDDNGLKFSNKLGSDATGLTIATPTGVLVDANAGADKQVVVTATLTTPGSDTDSTAYYELQPITFVKANVDKKPVEITVNNTNRAYGQENPAFTVGSYSLIEGDKLDGILKFTCEATPASLVTTEGYAITPYGLTSDNYAITFKSGKLTVEAINPEVELISATTVAKADNAGKEIQLKGRLIHSGGATTSATVSFAYTVAENSKEEQTASEQTVTASEIDKDGYFTGRFDVEAGKTYTIEAKATASDKTGSSASLAVVVDALTPQTISFGQNVLASCVYGSQMELSASSNKKEAVGDYAYTVTNGTGSATIKDNVLTATKVGKVTVTVSRPADNTNGFSSAVASQTIEIMPKPITVKEIGSISKEYDGNTSITEIPAFTLDGDAILSGDKTKGLAVKTEGISMSFTDKNAGEGKNVVLSQLVLTSTDGNTTAANYTLLQPTGVKGAITQKPLQVKVQDVERMWNERYTKYAFEAVEGGLVGNETLSTAYSGTFNVTEEDGVLHLDMEQAKCPNYELETLDGKLTINPGTPVAIVVKIVDTPTALLVDSAGYTGLTMSKVDAEGYANIMYNGTSIQRTLNNVPPVNNSSLMQQRSVQTKSNGSIWSESTKPSKYEYNKDETITLDGSETFASSDNQIVSVSGNTATIKGTGKVAIYATDGSKFAFLNITPKELVATGTMTKTYDGTTLTSGDLTLKDADGLDVVLDYSGITFNFSDKKATEMGTIIPSQSPILVGTEANNYALSLELTGKIEQKELKLNSASKYYDGSANAVVTDYDAEGLVNGDVVPVNVTFDAATVEAKTITSWSLVDQKGNYKVPSSSSPSGSILYSTIIAKIPAGGYSESNVKDQITLKIKETGADITGAAAAEIKKLITVKANGTNAYFVSATGDDNCSIVFDGDQQIGKTSEPSNPGPSIVSVESVSLDKAELTLPRLGTYTLKPTVNPSDASNKNVTWKSSDDKIATVDANGKVTAVAVGKATITVTTEDGGKTATCEVTVDFATGLEEAIANTAVYGKDGYIHIQPVAPMQAWVVNIAGTVVYHATISSATQIPVSTGIYLVKLGTGSESVVTKVSVR